MLRRHPGSTPTAALFPYTTLFRSCIWIMAAHLRGHRPPRCRSLPSTCAWKWGRTRESPLCPPPCRRCSHHAPRTSSSGGRSEEHTSELQSLMRISYAVLCWNKKHYRHTPITQRIMLLTEHNL